MAVAAARMIMWLTITTVLILLFRRSHGCSEQEKLALFQIKAFFMQGNILYSRLESWNSQNEDCCTWDEVTCDRTASHVTDLELPYLADFDAADGLDHCWNMSLFLPFQELKTVDLSDNYFTGFVHNGGPEKLRDLPNLQRLDLYANSFNESIFPSFSAGFSSLKELNLAENSLSSTTNISGLCNLRHLQLLDLSRNSMRGSLPLCFSNLTSLEELDLSSNRLSGNLASSPITMMTSIKHLDLSNNSFQVPSSLRPFFNLSKLQYVDLSHNMIYQDMEVLLPSAIPRFQLETLRLDCCGDVGSFPEFLSHQIHLQDISLSSISLKGKFPSWLLENNTNLQTLDLSNNSLSSPFQWFPHVSSHPFDNSSNTLDGYRPQKFGANLPKIYSLNMSNNLLEGRIPTSFFRYMKSLIFLDLSNNRLSGAILEDLSMVSMDSLNVLRLSNNGLHGTVFPENFNATVLVELMLDGNYFTGFGKNSIGGRWMNTLQILDIGNNRLSGRIPNWIANLTQLEQLIVANNYLEGPIPLELCNLDGVQILDLSNNNFSGRLPSCLSPSGINHLHLSKNRLKGSLTDMFCNSTMLVTLDLSNNQFSGTIPRCINKFPQLSYLFLNNNGIQGSIPRRLCQLERLSLLDLSHNNLSGPIPPCLNLTTLSDVSEYVVHRSRYTITSDSVEGPIEFTTKSASRSYKGRIITFMSGIDLSCNNLSGEIPQELGSLNKALHALNLSHNSLTGPIPMTFSNLQEIESLDLCFNRLSGSIPPQIVELHFLEVLNVSYNNLSGQTPKRVAQFATFDDTSYKGNPLLCGEPLQRSCSGTVKPVSHAVEEVGEVGEDSDLSDMNIFCISFAVSYTVALLAIATVLWVNPYWRGAWFYYVDMVSSSCYYFVLDHLPRQIW